MSASPILGGIAGNTGDGNSLNDNAPKNAGPDEILPYKYEELVEPVQIRVLELHATEGDRIEFNLKLVHHSDGGYQALSYVWGSEDKTFRATVRDGAGIALGYIPLTTSLADALRDLRDSEEVSSKVFWIDQICIDQEGDEKNHQVAMMGNIYKDALGVITYLGPAEDAELEQSAMELLPRVYRHFAPNYEPIYKMRSLFISFCRRTSLPVPALPEDLKKEVKACETGNWEDGASEKWVLLARLAFGDWTQRLWMVQEQMLNPINAMLRGRHLLSWDAVASLTLLFALDLLLLSCISYLWDKIQFDEDDWQPPPPFAESVFCIWLHRKKHFGETLDIAGGHCGMPGSVPLEQYNHLFDNMVRFQSLRCHDPRDRVFALRAISRDATEMAIAPDYSIQSTPEHLYHTITIHYLRASSKLGVILETACVWDNESSPSLPSWSFNHRRGPMLTPISGIPDSLAHPQIPRRSVPRFSCEGMVLTLKGRKVDGIRFASVPVYFTRGMFQGIIDKETRQRRAMWLSSLMGAASRLEMSLGTAMAVSRILLLKRVGLETAIQLWCFLNGELACFHKHLDIAEKNVAAFLEIYQRFVQQLANILFRDLGLTPPSPDEAEEHGGSFATRICWRGRSFGISERGMLLNAMNKAQEGDAVMAFEGAESLWVLRPAGDHRYRLVGAVWVEGLMSGEAYEGLDPDEVDYDVEIV